MKILLVGNSSLAQVLRPVLASFADVLTAGRRDCDVTLDLGWPVEQFRLPSGIDVVVNTAAHFAGPDFNAILAAEDINTLGGLKLCHAARAAGVRHFVQISSINAGLDSASDYYGIYAISKRHADEAIAYYCAKAKLPCAILRPSQLYGGAATFSRHQPFLYGTLEKALGNEDIVIYGSRDARRNYLHAQDFCRIIAAVVSGGVEGLYCCTSEQDSSLLEVANAAIKAAGSTSSVAFDLAMNDIPDNVFPYDDQLYRLTDTYPAIGIEDGIARLAADRSAA